MLPEGILQFFTNNKNNYNGVPLEPTQNWATFYDKINIGYLKIVKTIPNYVFRNPKSQYRWVTFDIAPELLQAEGAEPPDVAPHSKCIST